MTRQHWCGVPAPRRRCVPQRRAPDPCGVVSPGRNVVGGKEERCLGAERRGSSVRPCAHPRRGRLGLGLSAFSCVLVGFGVGKTSLVHLIDKGSAAVNPPRTVGCAVSVKLISCGNPGISSSSIKGDAEREFFVELWDVSGQDRYKDCRSLCYTQINGAIFIYDLSQRKTKTSLQNWALEIASAGTFSATLGPVGSLWASRPTSSYQQQSKKGQLVGVKVWSTLHASGLRSKVCFHQMKYSP